MKTYKSTGENLFEFGYTTIENVFTKTEISRIIELISQADSSNQTFRKSKDLFAIRQVLKEIPELKKLIFNAKLTCIINELLGDDIFVIKSIYFDKPSTSNWYVPYHQDLTISVDQKIVLENFTNWTIKQDQFAVQPPIEFLENITTIRIHLDETNESNGALKVIPKSHLKKIYRPETIDWQIEEEKICCVSSGGVMLMKPLVLHSSSRTTNNLQRRVLHIECTNLELPMPLHWSERLPINFELCKNLSYN